MARAAQLPFVSLVTVNWNGQRLLANLLPLLEAQSYPRDRFEIIVVDNDSTRDDSVNFVKEHFPNVVLVENTRNDGFARGCNLGMAVAKGDYLVMINNDTQPHKDWLACLVDCAVQEGHCGAVVSKVLFIGRGKGNIINNAGSVLHANKAWPVEEIGANEQDGPAYNKRREITALCGTSLLLSRAMLQDIGLFDELFFMYWEDAELSWRGQKAGWKFYYEPTSVVMHEHSASSKEHSDFWTFYVTRNRLLILWKHARFGLALRAQLAFVKEFLAVPIVRGLQGRERRHQLHMVKLGLRIKFSLLARLGPALLKRARLIQERKLPA
ncbi:MAG TPA: glycosyltransferase family 2 protein [Candidatus Saccharimonadales bacterium]|nr:glycosyltransferase family 2 protein [Candidatus Saccharimonadales bacterium]